MPEIVLHREKKVKPERYVGYGDLVLIDNDPFLVSCINEETFLIGLNDGNRWIDTHLNENPTEEELIKYIHQDSSDGYDVEVFKDNQYYISIKIK